MKVFTRDYRIEHYDSPLWGEYFNGLKSCVLDIEATGLDPSRCKLVLMGLLTETGTGVRVTQFLAENHYEENRVLEATIDFLKEEGIDYLITFNGLRYDMPFINTRLEKTGLNNVYDAIRLYDFDLYRFLRKCSVLPDKLSSLRQAAVEEYFGIAGDRQDTINGRESVALFDEYAVSGNSTIEKVILTHNREDVLQLYKLLKLAGRNDFGEILKFSSFHEAIARYGFPCENGRFTLRPSVSVSGHQLKICGDQLKETFSAAYFPDIDNPVTAMFKASNRSFEVDVPIETRDDICSQDKAFLDLRALNLSDELLNDADVVNDYLILNDRTINLFARKMMEKY